MRLFLKLTTLPVGGNVAKRQKVIPFLREMSRSDKRIADVLRVPFSPEKGGAPPKRRDGGGIPSDSAKLVKKTKCIRKDYPSVFLQAK